MLAAVALTYAFFEPEATPGERAMQVLERPELLRKGDLTLGAGVTYYKAPGGAWGQYTVLFVLIRPPGAEV